MRPRCPRCGEKINHDHPLDSRGVDSHEWHENPFGDLLEWLRCGMCRKLSPTLNGIRRRPFNHYPGDHARPEPPPPRDPPRAPPRTREPSPWWVGELGLERLPAARRDAIRVVRARYRKLVHRWHPDRPGGSGPRMERINVAMDQAREHLGF